MMNHLKKTYIPPIASNGPVKAKQMQNTHVHSGRRENKSKRRSEDTPNSNVQALKAKTQAAFNHVYQKPAQKSMYQQFSQL